MEGFYLDLDKGPGHWPIWTRLSRAFNLMNTLRAPDEDFPNGIPIKTAWESAWIVWRKCPCGKCNPDGPWGERP